MSAFIHVSHILADETGSIVSGKSADFIVLDRNLFKVPANQIGKVKVEKTFFQGREVYTPHMHTCRTV